MSAIASINPGATPKIESSDLTIAKLLQDFYVVPDFQREYVWQPENVERLLQDVLDEFFDEDGRIIPATEYFIGSIVACPEQSSVFQLIDGQQRLTTLYLTLCAIRDCIAESGSEVPVMLQGQISDQRMDPNTFQTYSDFRLVLQYEDSHDALEQIARRLDSIDQMPAPTGSIRNMVAAYKAIREFLSVNFSDDPARVFQFYGAFTQRVKLIRIVTPNIAHALKVFETINDRGVGLNAMDLLKNLLFMRTGTQDYPRLKDRWKDLTDTLNGCGEKPLRFLRYYIMSHYETDTSRGLREDEIYQWFVEHSDETGIDRIPLAFVDQLVSRAEAYANFIRARDARSEPSRYLRNLQVVSGTARQHFILLLAGQHLRRAEFEELCRHIENLFFTFIITREQTKTLERIFARSAANLRTVQTQEELEEFVRRYLLPETANRRRAFDFAFNELTTKRIQQYRMRYILAKLTQYIQENAWSIQSDQNIDSFLDASIHIEHILPQRPADGVREAFDHPDEYDSYVIKLGNLTLLERTINISVSNGSYEQKQPGYVQSGLLLTKSLVAQPQIGSHTQLNRAVSDLIQFEDWDSVSIDLRQEMLRDLAQRVWLQDAMNVTTDGHQA